MQIWSYMFVRGLRIKVDSHYTAQHDTKNQRAFTSAGSDKQHILSPCKRQSLSVFVVTCQ
jgi:hypothetical protein